MAQYPVRTGPLVDDQAPFSPEMVAGWQPVAPRPHMVGQAGWVTSQTTHTDAPFSVEMAAGWQPDAPRLFRVKLGWVWSETTFAELMTPEMFGGWVPARPRLFLAPRIPLPLHQAAQHVEAPFSLEMVAGWQAASPRPRAHVREKLGWTWSEPTFVGPTPSAAADDQIRLGVELGGHVFGSPVLGGWIG